MRKSLPAGRRGFAAILILGLVVAAFALGGAFYLKQRSTTQPIVKQSPQASPSPAETADLKTYTIDTNKKTFTDNKYKYSFNYPSDFKTFPQLINDQSQNNVNTSSLYSPDTEYSKQGGWPLSGIEIRSFVLSTKTDVDQQKTQNLPNLFSHSNPPDIDNSIVTNNLHLPDGVTSNAYTQNHGADRPFVIVNFFKDYNGSEIAIQLMCIGDTKRCKNTLSQILPTFKFTN